MNGEVLFYGNLHQESSNKDEARNPFLAKITRNPLLPSLPVTIDVTNTPTIHVEGKDLDDLLYLAADERVSFNLLKYL